MKLRNLFFLFMFIILILLITSCNSGGNIIIVNNESENNNVIITQPSSLSSQPQMTCSQSNGFECKYNEYCSSNLLNVSGSEECCSTQCTKYQKTNTCNYNTIMEGWEDSSCKDLQCQGVVCGGLCYNTEGVCCGDKFIVGKGKVYCDINSVPFAESCSIPGRCYDSQDPLIVEFDIPNLYELNKITNGIIRIKNNGNNEINKDLSWEYNPKFEILTSSNLELKNEIKNISLPPGEEILIYLKINAKEKYNLLDSRGEIFSKLTLKILDNDGISQILNSNNMIIFVPDRLTSCGNNNFIVKGVCINNVFYPDLDCITEETGTIKDYSNFNYCVNGFNISTFYGYYPDVAKFHYWGDVIPKGEIKVVLVKVNKNIDLDVNSLQNWVETFYDIQSEKILGKNMVDFVFKDLGVIYLDWRNINNIGEIQESLERSLNLNRNDYDIIIAYVDPSETNLLPESYAGLNIWGNHTILMNSNHNNMWTVTHEIAHSFGALDLYINDSLGRPLSCAFQFINDIMCGSSSIDSSPLDIPSYYNFYTAPYIGWSDLDGDNIIDIEDDYLLRAPSWSQGIKILDARVLYSTYMDGSADFRVHVYVVDKKTQKLIPSFITINSSIYNYKNYNPGKEEFTTFPSVPTSPIDITVTAEYGNLRDTRIITFDPNNHINRKSKYDPLINGP